jgi:hypothetical protein
MQNTHQDTFLEVTDIFGQNMGIFPLWWPYIVLPPAVWQLILEEILTCFVINVFLWIFCIIKWSKLGGYWHNTTIWGILWSKYGDLTPWGDPIILCYHLLFGNSFWRNTNMLCPKCNFVYIFYHQRDQIGKVLA